MAIIDNDKVTSTPEGGGGGSTTITTGSRLRINGLYPRPFYYSCNNQSLNVSSSVNVILDSSTSKKIDLLKKRPALNNGGVGLSTSINKLLIWPPDEKPHGSFEGRCSPISYGRTDGGARDYGYRENVRELLLDNRYKIATVNTYPDINTQVEYLRIDFEVATVWFAYGAPEAPTPLWLVSSDSYVLLGIGFGNFYTDNNGSFKAPGISLGDGTKTLLELKDGTFIEDTYWSDGTDWPQYTFNFSLIFEHMYDGSGTYVTLLQGDKKLSANLKDILQGKDIAYILQLDMSSDGSTQFTSGTYYYNVTHKDYTFR